MTRTKAKCLEFRRKRQYLRYVKAFRRMIKLSQQLSHLRRVDDFSRNIRPWRGMFDDCNRWQAELRPKP